MKEDLIDRLTARVFRFEMETGKAPEVLEVTGEEYRELMDRSSFKSSCRSGATFNGTPLKIVQDEVQSPQ